MAIKIALAGNPNCGKTTMFNDLTGLNQFVGNWPGVTVEKKEGRLKGADDVIIQDLPGIYSLSPYTLEEVVARGYLVNEKPDAILNIVDATNIERNLYLTTQLAELGIPNGHRPEHDRRHAQERRRHPTAQAGRGAGLRSGGDFGAQGHGKPGSGEKGRGTWQKGRPPRAAARIRRQRGTRACAH